MKCIASLAILIPARNQFSILLLAVRRQSDTSHLLPIDHKLLVLLALFHLIRLYYLVLDPGGVVGQHLKDLLVGHQNVACCQLDLLILTIALLDLDLLRLSLLQLISILLSLWLFNNLQWKRKLVLIRTTVLSRHILVAVAAAVGSAFRHDFVLNAGAGEE